MCQCLINNSVCVCILFYFVIFRQAFNNIYNAFTLAVILKNEMFKDQLIGLSKVIGKILLLTLTLYISFAYGLALSMKIEYPNFKNLPTREFLILGVLIIVLIIINLRVFGLWKTKRKEEE